MVLISFRAFAYCFDNPPTHWGAKPSIFYYIKSIEYEHFLVLYNMNKFYNYISSNSNTIYNPEDNIKKEARGLGDDADLVKYKKLV
jgi:hypothetical protein